MVGSLLPLAACVLIYRLSDGVCPIRQLLGIPCPGCGMTRAVFSVLRGEFAAALTFHPLVWTLPLIALILFRAVAPHIFRRFLLRLGIREEAYLRAEVIAAPSLLVLYLAVYILRLLSGWNG